MTQKLRGAKADPGGVSAGRVVEYLRQNPDFFVKHPDALQTIQAPSRTLGEGVYDLQQAMIDRLRGEIETLKGDRHELLSATRANMQTQSRIHDCVLRLLGAVVIQAFFYHPHRPSAPAARVRRHVPRGLPPAAGSSVRTHPTPD